MAAVSNACYLGNASLFIDFNAQLTTFNKLENCAVLISGTINLPSLKEGVYENITRIKLYSKNSFAVIEKLTNSCPNLQKLSIEGEEFDNFQDVGRRRYEATVTISRSTFPLKLSALDIPRENGRGGINTAYQNISRKIGFDGKRTA